MLHRHLYGWLQWCQAKSRKRSKVKEEKKNTQKDVRAAYQATIFKQQRVSEDKNRMSGSVTFSLSYNSTYSFSMCKHIHTHTHAWRLYPNEQIFRSVYVHICLDIILVLFINSGALLNIPFVHSFILFAENTHFKRAHLLLHRYRFLLLNNQYRCRVVIELNQQC